ncbi:MAG: 3-phosphoglycerate dehydrogenase, partial [Clostridia bacterium]|nr:3-phosphoglycerate dehydrogenase [Clostridia bacterium]
MYKIKTYNKISKSGLEVFDDKYTIGDEVENADGAIVRSAALHDVEFPASLKAIARAGAGTNNIPIDRCSEQGIVVFNTPGANANAVKELVIAGLLISSRRVISGIEWAKTLKGEGDAVGKLVEKGKGAFAGPEIKCKSLGVIGLGAIGVMVANAANHLGMKVYGYDPYLSVKSAWNLNHNAVYINDINEIFAKCDYITIHVPLTDSTKNL